MQHTNFAYPQQNHAIKRGSRLETTSLIHRYSHYNALEAVQPRTRFQNIRNDEMRVLSVTRKGLLISTFQSKSEICLANIHEILTRAHKLDAHNRSHPKYFVQNGKKQGPLGLVWTPFSTFSLTDPSIFPSPTPNLLRPIQILPQSLQFNLPALRPIPPQR